MKFLLALFVFFQITFVSAQISTYDSLQLVLKNAHHDTTVYKAHFLLGNYYKTSNPDSSIYFFDRALVVAKSLEDNVKIANTLRNIGWEHFVKGDYETALSNYHEGLEHVELEIASKKGLDLKEPYKVKAAILSNEGVICASKAEYDSALVYFQESMAIDKRIGHNENIARNLSNIGIVYYEQTDFDAALESHFNALQLNEFYKNKAGIYSTQVNIALVYSAMGENTKAIEFNLLALESLKEMGDEIGQAKVLGNIGIVYREMGQYDTALYYFNEAIIIARENNVRRTEATNLMNIANVYAEQMEFEKALEYYFQSLEITIEIGNTRGRTMNLAGIGDVYLKLEKYPLAKKYLEESEKLSRETNLLSELQSNCFNLSKLYEKTGQPLLALTYYKEYISVLDSIKSEENQKAIFQQEMKFEYEKKAAQDSLETAKNNEVQVAQLAARDADIEAKENEQIALFGGLFLVLVLAGVMYNRFKVTQKQKRIIEAKEKETHIQKEIIEEKHKEITDSINYAERIQRSFLASEEMLQKNLSDYFVLFKPKDVVSGDFYWAAELANGNFVYSTADSTGHGVPGAIMSILNISSLEKAIEKATEPAAILNATRKLIIERLRKDGSVDGGRDGMDCSVCVIDKSRKKLLVSAANNNVWLVRKSEVIEIKADKMPVGKHEKQHIDFVQQSIDLQSDDVIYTLTDGFPDQFGGENGKKFMTKNLRNLLLNISHLPMRKQQQMLEDTLKKWVGELDQVDDITIIGIRIA